MALKKVMEVEGEAFVSIPGGQANFGHQKSAFNAYCKITSLVGNKETGTVTVQCEAENYKVIQQYEVPLSVSDSAPNFIKQAYLHLKTLPEWADATDC